MSKKGKSKPVSKCNLVQMDISEAFNKWYHLQRMKETKKKVRKFNSSIIFEIRDTDSESESEGYTDYISSIKERDLPFKILQDDEENRKSVPPSQETGSPPNVIATPSKLVNIGVNRPAKLNQQLIQPKATSTPIKGPAPSMYNSHVGVKDFSDISKNDTRTHNDSGSVSDTDSERTIICETSNLSKTSANKSIKIIGNHIIPNKANCVDCSSNNLNGSQSSTNTTIIETSSPARKRIADDESISKRQKVSHTYKEKKSVNKKLFGDDVRESENLTNSSANVKNFNGSSSQVDAEKIPKEQRGNQLDDTQTKRATKNLSEKEKKIDSDGESKSGENESMQSVKGKIAENADDATQKESNRDERLSKTAPSKDKGKTMLKSTEEKQTSNSSSSQPSCSALLSQKVNITDPASVVTANEGSKDNSGESAQNTQGMDKGKRLPKSTEESQASKSVSHPSSPEKGGNAKETAKVEGKEMNVKYVTLIQELFNSVYKTNYLNNLPDDDKEAVNLFRDMNTHYQYVCIKLFTWQWRWYNIYKFCNRIHLNMGDSMVCEMFHFFKEKGIVDTDFANDEVRVLLELLDPLDLRSIRDKFKLKKTLTAKQDIINALLMCCSTQATLTPTKSTLSILMEEVEHKLGHSIRLSESFRDAFYRTYILATFANPTFSKMTDYFRNLLHLRIAFPEFPIEDYTIFYSKDEFVRYAKARKYKDALEEVLGKNHIESLGICKDIFEELRRTKDDQQDYEDRYRNTPHLVRFTARAVYVSALSNAMSTLATKFPTDARDWLEYMINEVNFPHRIGDWYYHLSWLYMRYLEPINCMHAAQLIIHVLQERKDDLSDVQLHQLGKRGQALKVTKKYKISQLYHDRIAELVPEPINVNEFPTISIDASTIRSNELGKKRDYVILDKEGNKTFLNVEYIALMHYLGNGYTDGRHCEGSIIMATFTLFFWDIIYSAKDIVPGTFVSKVQSEPLDINSSHFYANRKNAIDRRLEEIETTWSDSELIKFAKENYNHYSHLVALCRVDQFIKEVELLEVVINCVGRVVLAKIYSRFVKNIRRYRSGLPDLLIWNADEKKSKFVEVKGENDTLSLGQTLWLDYLRSIGASIEVCKVHSLGSKRKKAQKPEGDKTMEPSTSTSPVVAKCRKKALKEETKPSIKPSASSSFIGAKGKKKIQRSEVNTPTSPVVAKCRKKALKEEAKPSIKPSAFSSFVGAKGKKKIRRSEVDVCMEPTSSSDEFESECD